MAGRTVKLFLLVLLAGGSAFADRCGRFIEDITGQEVCIPPKIERIIITCYGGAAQEIALFMGSDRIVAQPGVGQFTQFARLYPDAAALPSVGSFGDVNLERLLTLQPDMVFAGIVSGPMNDKIRDFGIPVYTLGIGRHNVQTLLEEFQRVGRLLDREAKATDLVAYWEEKLAMIRRTLSAVRTRQKVFYTGSSGNSTEGRHWWGDDFITAAGGVNVAGSLKIKGAVSAETVTLWDPDVIVTSTDKAGAMSAERFREQPVYGEVRAVREGRVYAAPVGTFWWDRPSPESILGILWLSKQLYPDAMKEVDLKKETKAFYERFYAYSLSDGEYEQFFK